MYALVCRECGRRECHDGYNRAVLYTMPRDAAPRPDVGERSKAHSICTESEFNLTAHSDVPVGPDRALQLPCSAREGAAVQQP